MSEHIIPEGYRKNAQGHLVHESEIREQDKLRDQFVLNAVAEALALQEQLKNFKGRMLGDIEDLIEISAQNYGVSMGGKKGNVQMMSFDGRFKVERNCQSVMTFSEEIETAKALIDKCLVKWSNDSNAHLVSLVNNAFRTNGNGQLKTGEVLALTRCEIDDADWKTAMVALKDALHVLNTSTYVRLYQRVGDSDVWKPISLDLAKMVV